MGRVVFTSTKKTLGVLYNGYTNGMPITVAQGESQDITIYNGELAGPLSIDITLSGASSLVAGVAAAGAVMSSLF